MKNIVKSFLKRFVWLSVFLSLLLWWLTYFESNHQLTNYDTLLWINLTKSSSTKYWAESRSEHLWYLNTFDHQDGNIRYIDRGQKESPVVVLIHWTPTNSWLYRKMIPLLVSRWYRVIAPDMIGFWASSMAKNNSDLSIQSQSKRIIDLMNYLDIETFAIAWHDQWSLWVWETIVTHPKRISHLIILNSIWVREWFHPPVWFGSDNKLTKWISRAMWSKPLWRIMAYGAMLGGLNDKTLATTSMIDWYLSPLLNGANKSYYEFITHFDMLPAQIESYHLQFTGISIPTIIIRWKDDAILVWEDQIPKLKTLFSVADENIHILEDAAHFIQEEKPELIVQYIDAFMKK